MVTNSGKYYGQPFSMGRGVTQGDPVSPTIFNIIVDAVVRETIQEICGPQEDQHGFGWSAGEHNICFYADDGRISGQYPIWVQAALRKIVRIFVRFGLQINLNNTKAEICTPGVHLGTIGSLRVQTTRHRGGNNLSGKEENQGTFVRINVVD